MCKTSAAPPLIAASSPSCDPTISTHRRGDRRALRHRRARAREQPRRERSERPGQHDAPRVDHRDGRCDADAEDLADLVERARSRRRSPPRARSATSEAGDDVSLRVPWMPTLRAIASWPASVSRQPRPPQRHRSPSKGRTGMWPISPAKPSVPGKIAPSTITRAADADVAVDQEPVADAAQRAALELAERGEVGVVADADREGGVAERVAQELGRRAPRPSRGSGRASACPLAPRPCPGRRRRRRSASGRARRTRRARAPASSASVSKTSACELSRLSCPTAAAIADRPAQVAHADREVVDVDLESERRDAAVVELEDLRRAPDAAAVREARLGHHAALDELGDEARDRGLVEPRELRQLRARERAAVAMRRATRPRLDLRTARWSARLTGAEEVESGFTGAPAADPRYGIAARFAARPRDTTRKELPSWAASRPASASGPSARW